MQFLSPDGGLCTLDTHEITAFMKPPAQTRLYPGLINVAPPQSDLKTLSAYFTECKTKMEVGFR